MLESLSGPARLGVIVATLGGLALVPAVATGAEIPPTATYEDAGDGKWVWRVDPARYGGASGSITFSDEGYRGPGGAGPNDFQVGDGFDPENRSFVQSVEVVEADGITADPLHTVYADDLFGMGGHPSSAFEGANMDGQVNLGNFAWTTPPGTKFVNMQIDKAGNYFVAKRDMQWGFFDEYKYRSATGELRTRDTSFNFQPYPLSDAYGFCGSVLTSEPTALERQSGQLVFDVAFDVYPNDGGPGSGRPSTQVVPGFVMRSYGAYTVQVKNGMGQSQRFTARASGINYNPVTGQLDRAFYQRVSPLGAGVIPDGAWVLNEGTPDMKVVPEGTPGATYHKNTFAGFAFLLRGDVARTVTDLPGADYEARSTWSAWPLAAELKRRVRLRVSRASVRGSRLTVAGRAGAPADGVVDLRYDAQVGTRRLRVRRSTRLENGRFVASVRLPAGVARAPGGTLTVRYRGNDLYRAASARRVVR